MKRIINVILWGILSLASSACAEEYLYNVGPFDRISVRGDIDVVYRSVPDSVGIAVFNSDTDLSDAFDVTCAKGKLSIKENLNHDHKAPLPVIYVYADFLKNIDYEGNGTLDATLSANAPTLAIKLIGNGKILCQGIRCTDLKASIDTGNGQIVLGGKCDEAKFNLTGSGVLQADNLDAETVKCNVLGTGTIGCSPAVALDVRGIGTTKIYYSGDPTIKKSGGAKLIRLN